MIGRSDVEGISWPPIKLAANATLAALLDELERTQFLPTDELERRQSRQLKLLLTHINRHSPYFTQRLKDAGLSPPDISTTEDLRALPVMSRRDIQSAGSGFFCDSLPQSHRPPGEVKTSGSTGEPVTVQKTAINRLLWSALTIRDHLWHRRDFGGRFTSIRANMQRFVQLPNWGMPVNGLYETGPAQGIPITTDIREQLRLIAEFKPDFLLIYPSNLMGFVTVWQSGEADIPRLRHIKTIGETVSTQLRTMIRELTGLEIEDNYSSQEVGTIAIQCKEGGQYHAMSETLIVEVLDERGAPCPEGAVGRVVVTDLHNFASPMVRYDIGDYAEVGGTCACGRTLPAFKQIRGRERNLVKKPDGTRNWPMVGFHQFRDIAPVNQYQLVQKSLEEIEMKVVAAASLGDDQKQALIEVVQKALGYPFRIDITEHEGRLPIGKNGKFEEFVSLI